MDREVAPESRGSFEAHLAKWHIPASHYKALEAIFRQTMMSHPEIKYRYDNDWIEPALARPMAPEQRWIEINAYIDKWEEKANMQYGFGGVYLDELEQLKSALDSYDQFRSIIKDLSKKSKMAFDETVTKKFLKELQKNIQQKSRVERRANKRLISFDGDNRPVLNIPLHDYFLRYFEISMAVFDPYFSRVCRQTGEYEVKGNNIYRFLSEKVKKEHSDILPASESTPERIKARYDNNRRGREKWAGGPEGLNIIDMPFISYLLDQNSHLKVRNVS